MAEETSELSPEVEEPTPQAEAEPTRNVDDLLAELKNAGVENTTQLQGKLDASAQAGRAFQLLGDERKRSETLQVQIDKLKSQPPKEQDWDAYPEGRPIDIESAIERGIDKTLLKRETAQRQAQEASIQAYNTIKNDQNYHLVEDVWNEKIKDPAYVYQVQTGQVDPIRDFQGTVVSYFQNIAKESYETIKELSSGVKTTAPHVESGESHSPNVVTEGKGVSANRQFLDKIRKKIYTEGYTASEEEEAMIAVAVLEESNE